jgi:MarR family transcriptional regulator, organic hydroperoxide resistance regulator
MHEGQIIDLISRIRGRAHERIAAELERRGHPGLVPSHGAVLAMLYGGGALPMSVLARGVGRRKNTLTALVRKLEELGYVRRGQDPADSRVTLVSLTPRGEAFRADFDAVSGLLLGTVWGGMESGRRAELLRGLEELLANLG